MTFKTRWLALAGMTAACCAHAQPPVASPASPYTLEWTEGTCGNCGNDPQLAIVQFVDAHTAWGVIETKGSDPVGSFYSVAYTHDGGKTWAEIPEGAHQDFPPAISFANPNEGWIEIHEGLDGHGALLETTDGGSHWRRLPLDTGFLVDAIRFQGQGVGHVHGFTIKASGLASAILSTTDDGHTWLRSVLPNNGIASFLEFSDTRHGWLAGPCDKSHVTTFATIDGGRNWKKAKTEIVPDLPSDHCELLAIDFSAVDARELWLLSVEPKPSGDPNPVSIVSHSTDGGTTWQPALPIGSALKKADLTTLQFLDSRIGFLAERPRDTGRGHGVEVGGALHFTSDGGRTWQRAELPRTVFGCRRDAGGLACIGENGLRILRIRRAAP